MTAIKKADVQFRVEKETIRVGEKSRERVVGVHAYHEPSVIVVSVRGSSVASTIARALEKLRHVAKVEAAGRAGPNRRRFRAARNARLSARNMARVRYA
jgi:hypothetical protein